MQASRLLQILMLLQARGRMTAPQLAEAMEVSKRTILRDIDQLSAAGVPLWAERGRQGGFQLRAGWSTQLTGMTGPEASALLLAGLPGPATELGLGSAAASARLKMVASLPPEWREQADRVGQRLHIDPVDWYRAPDTPRFLREAADAVWQGKRIRVRYESWRATTDRELDPLGLVLKAGAWYLMARPADRDEPRTYRLASLLALTVLSHAVKRPRGFDLARSWEASSRRFEAELRRLQARLRVSPRGMVRLRNMRLPMVVLPGRTPAKADDWQEVMLSLESLEQGALQVLGFGPELEVLAPAALRKQVVALIRRVGALYAGFRADGVRQGNTP